MSGDKAPRPPVPLDRHRLEERLERIRLVEQVVRRIPQPDEGQHHSRVYIAKEDIAEGCIQLNDISGCRVQIAEELEELIFRLDRQFDLPSNLRLY